MLPRRLPLGLRQGVASGSVDEGIFRAAVLVGSFSILIKIAATARELLVANNFGRSDQVDAFLIAFVLPQTIINLVSSAFSASLIPVFSAVRAERGQIAAESLLTRTLVASEGILVAFSLLAATCTPCIIRVLGSGFSPTKRDLTCRLFYWLLPTVAFNGMTVILGAVLNVHRRFLATSCTPMVTPLLTLMLVGTCARIWGVWTLVIGTFAGSCVESLIMLNYFLAHGLKLRWKQCGLNGELRLVLRQYLPLLGGGILTGGLGLVDQAVTADMPAGSVGAYAYGTRIVGVILAVVSGSMSTALTPYFAEMVTHGDWSGCRTTIRTYSRLMIAISLPLTMGMICFSYPLVRGLYQHGAFTATDTSVVSGVQIANSISIPFVSVGIIYVRFLSTVRRNEILMASAAVNLVLDVVFDVVFGKIFGVAGVALATSGFYVVSCAMLVCYGHRELRRLSAISLPILPCETSACD